MVAPLLVFDSPDQPRRTCLWTGPTWPPPKILLLMIGGLSGVESWVDPETLDPLQLIAAADLLTVTVIKFERTSASDLDASIDTEAHVVRSAQYQEVP